MATATALAVGTLPASASAAVRPATPVAAAHDAQPPLNIPLGFGWG